MNRTFIRRTSSDTSKSLSFNPAAKGKAGEYLMIMSRNTVAVAAITLFLSSSGAFAQTGTATGGGAEGSMSSATGMSGGMKGDMKPGMKPDGMKSGMSKSGGMKGDMQSGGMKSDNGMTDKKM